MRADWASSRAPPKSRRATQGARRSLSSDTWSPISWQERLAAKGWSDAAGARIRSAEEGCRRQNGSWSFGLAGRRTGRAGAAPDSGGWSSPRDSLGSRRSSPEDASQISTTQGYCCVGPKAVPFAIAAGLFLLSMATAIEAIHGDTPEHMPRLVPSSIWIESPGQIALMGLTSIRPRCRRDRARFRRQALCHFADRVAISLALWLLFAKASILRSCRR